MVSKKVIIGAVVVVAIIAIAAVAMGSSDDDKAADVRYNYSAELVKSFTTSVSGAEPETAPEGKQYLIVSYKAFNDSWDAGVSTNDIMWQWKATVNGISYSDSVVGYLHPGHQLIKIEKGGNGGSVVIFEIPDTIAMSDIEISQKYVDFKVPKIERDTTIVV